VRLARALHAEWTKLRTVPATACLPPATVVATAALGTAVSTSCGGDCDAARLSLSGVYLGQLAVVALAVLAAAGEYRHGLAATTLMAVPARLVAFTAKALAVTAAVLPAAALAVAASLAASRAPLPPGPSLRAGGGTVVYLVLVALLALGVAATIRRTAPALSTVLGLLYMAPIAAQFVTDDRWRTLIERATPAPAALAIQDTTDPAHPWSGLAVLAAWTAAALTAGATAFIRRDG